MNGRKKTTNVGLPAACRAAAAAAAPSSMITSQSQAASLQCRQNTRASHQLSQCPCSGYVVTVLQLAICLQQVEIFNGICQVCGITRYTPPGQQQSGRGGQKKFRKI